MSTNVNEIIKEFSDRRNMYDQFGQMMSALIKRLMHSSNIQTHSIHYRVKDASSLKNKIELKNKYKSCSDITDILGVRIICYYSNDVDRIEKIINEHFDIDHENTIDKRKTYEPDRFGYMSLHYIVSLDSSRHCLIEYSEFQDIKFEIQIRTILQHTWAEIEHDLGYKTTSSIPEHIRRKFSILSGTLELIDSAFIEIKNSLEQYANDVKSELVKSIPFENSNIETLNDVFMRSFAENSSIFNKEYSIYVKTKKEKGFSQVIYPAHYTADNDTSYQSIIKLLTEINIVTPVAFINLMHEILVDKEIIEKLIIFDNVHERDGISSKYFFMLYILYVYIVTKQEHHPPSSSFTDMINCCRNVLSKSEQ